MQYQTTLNTNDKDNEEFLKELLESNPIKELEGREELFTVSRVDFEGYPNKEYANAFIVPKVSNLAKAFTIRYKRLNVENVIDEMLFEDPRKEGGFVIPSGDVSLNQVIELLQKYLGDKMKITKKDFYDVYIRSNVFGSYLDIHARPNSYRYYGNYHVRVRIATEETLPRISFKVTTMAKTSEPSLKFDVEVLAK